MSIRARQFLILALVSAFSFQSWLVYSDPSGRGNALSAPAQSGRAIWHENGCQTCHQFYGFGGFLGPDLTNAAQHLTQARIDSVLTVGAGQMPAFHFSEAERLALASFLTEMDATGIGQLPPRVTISATEVFARATEAAVALHQPLTETQARGRTVFREQKCIACHLPNPVSLKRAPDLTGAVRKNGIASVSGIVTTGIPSRGMPRFDLVTADLEGLLAFLSWLGAHAEIVHREFSEAMPREALGSLDLPWFEYR